MRKLTKAQKRDIEAIAAKKDRDIDFSDAPALIDWSKAEIGKFYRPKKQPVTMRLDSDVVEWLKEEGPGYQTKANWLLRTAMLQMEGKPLERSRPHRRRAPASQKKQADAADRRRDIEGAAQVPASPRTELAANPFEH